jgi:GDP-4-dehydro-6-deoxy-D-mannose reductase
MRPNRILVTGAEGFVGGHLLPALREAFPQTGIIGTSRSRAADETLDVTDFSQAWALFTRIEPDFCIHLAGIAAVGEARADPERAWAVNLHGSLNLGRAILTAAPACRMIFVSSAECYGASFNIGTPVSEEAVLAPMNLYAATKAAAELALGVMCGDGLRLLRLRPFNHTGPGQSPDFGVPAFATQIARIEAGLNPPEMLVGNLESERDFLDIRDVCAAYIASIRHFDRLPNNQIINIASGKSVRIGALLQELLRRSERPITVRQDPARLRPVEIGRAVGDATRARVLLGWEPRFALEAMLRTVLDDARHKIAAAQG